MKKWVRRKDLWKGSDWITYQNTENPKEFINIGKLVYDKPYTSHPFFVSTPKGKSWFMTKKEALNESKRMRK